jgi:RNA polymerase sigma-70 factor (ECF subfamily)
VHALPVASVAVHRRRPTERSELRLAQSGDRTAMAALLQRHRAQIERICRRLCAPHQGDAQYEDVLQETYLAIMRHLSAFRGESAFLTWVYTIARTYRGRYGRRAARERGREESLRSSAAIVSPRADVEQSLAERELAEAIERALADLGELDRTVAVMRDVEGMSAAEVAERTGLTVPAVKTRLHRARVAIRERLGQVRNDFLLSGDAV